ncbi:adenylate/guanylate cyclase domain-containing protein [uncultured Microscilla sp.]|uniref:adenylate/guanylate cyclase domain-containing protein n=1 Tax=uncultured Microscilla sp. TaxID=432653 RepID=UPI002630AF8D|nr:adenylate/guanylate cyclase domain-containing protein [uncultured Microscilla sp.]
MKKYLVFFYISMLISCSCFELHAQKQVTVKGFIVDKKGKALQNIDIRDFNGNHITFTDFKGYFQFLYANELVFELPFQVKQDDKPPYTFKYSGKELTLQITNKGLVDITGRKTAIIKKDTTKATDTSQKKTSPVPLPVVTKKIEKDAPSVVKIKKLSAELDKINSELEATTRQLTELKKLNGQKIDSLQQYVKYLVKMLESNNVEYKKVASLAGKKTLLEKDLEIRIQKIKTNLAEKERDLARAKNDLTEEETRRATWVFSLVALALIIIAALMYQSSKRQKKANVLLSQKNDEISQQRDVIEIERQKSEGLLLNILPRQVAEEYKTKGRVDIRNYERVSVMFTDFKGFTKISEKMPPEEVVEELNYCFSTFDEITDKYQIQKIKTIGDAYMCAGGIPDPNTTNPVDVVLAGLEIQFFMKQRREEKQKAGEDYWQCRLGVNTGDALSAVIGKSKFTYDIWSDTVNTASRMENSGEVGKVNVGQNTYELIKEFFECEHRGKVAAKGKGELDMYFVYRLKPELSADETGVVPNANYDKLREEKFLSITAVTKS